MWLLSVILALGLRVVSEVESNLNFNVGLSNWVMVYVQTEYLRLCGKLE
jgi:hypothetical protein